MAESAQAIELDTLQREALRPQLAAFLDAASESDARAFYAALLEAVEALSVPAGDLQERLSAIIEVALSSGRVRRMAGPSAELALFSLFQKTPRGREIGASIAALNQAFARLTGQALEQLATSFKGPGSYGLTIKTAQCQLVVRFEPGGVRVESLDVDLA